MFVFDLENIYLCLRFVNNIVSFLNLVVRRVQSNYELRNYLVQVVEETSFDFKVLMCRIIGFFNLFYDCGILLSQVLDTMLEKLIFMGFHDSWLYHKSVYF